MHPCAKPFCKTLVVRGQARCDVHESERIRAYEQTRGSASSRGYNHKWTLARKAHLLAHPFCVKCLQRGLSVKATDVDHIVPHKGDAELFWSEANWQSLCHACHSSKTAREDGRWEPRA